MKILILDIETTGLTANNSDLLEIGMVFYDTDVHLSGTYGELLRNVPKERIIVHSNPKNLQGNLTAFKMHEKTLIPLFEEISAIYKSTDFQTKFEANTFATNMVQSKTFTPNTNVYIVEKDYVTDLIKDLCVKHEFNGTLTVAGKNVTTFDLPYLREYLPDFKTIRTRSRTFDPTVLYTDFSCDRLPDLKQCKERAKSIDLDFPYYGSDTAHTAVEDCMDIANLIHCGILNDLYKVDTSVTVHIGGVYNV